MVWIKRQFFSILRSLCLLALVLSIVGLGAQFAFQAAPNDGLRQGDRLFAHGEYYAALRAYHASLRQAAGPRSLLRIGMLETARGEVTDANRRFAQALQLGLFGEDYALLRLYQGQAALLNGQRNEAFGLWRTIGDQAPLRAYAHMLEAEALLDSGDYAGAEARYQTALKGELQPIWRNTAINRLALLRASSDQPGALALLNTITPQTTTSDTLLLLPLLPSAQPTRAQLLDVLHAPPDQRAVRLGQIYLAARLYGLAEAQFAANATDHAEATSARTYAAYARLRAGDRAGAIARLDAIVASDPSDIRPRTLLAFAYSGQGDRMRARAQLDMVRQLAPRSAGTHLVWAEWYAAQSDYSTAAAEYRLALDAAPVEQRGMYLLALVRFHLDSTLRVCEEGQPAAEQAARLLDNGAAWTVLSAARLSCGDPAGARSAAERALERDAGNAEAAFYRGQALMLLGQREAARQALIVAADLAPASNWRVKAERSLALAGL